MNDEQPILAVTHNGLFHTDEVMACALLRLSAGSSHVAIIRSRFPKDWERADYLLDVGGKYDEIKFFDHHQPESTGKRVDGTGYSCFGLLWKSLGITAVRELLTPYKMDDSMILKVVADMEKFVKSVDLHDQGQLNVSARWTGDRGVHIEVATLQSIISGMNAIPFIDEAKQSNEDRFYTAVDFAENFLERLIYRKASGVMADRYVSSRIKPDNDILFLEEYCDWYDVVCKVKHINFVIYPSSNGKAYTVQAVKQGGGANSVKNLRVPFPESWAGQTDIALAKISGVSDALFCHRDRFIASAATLEGAVAIANLSSKLHNKV